MMKLSVHLVTWNGEKYIPLLFKSLQEQTFKDWFLFVWDNNSSDNTVGLIKNDINKLGVQYKIIENKENAGFVGGHNEVFKMTFGEYVLLLNQDMYLPTNCLEKLVEFMDARSESAAVSPRLMKWDRESLNTNKHESIEKSFTDCVDSLGLKAHRNRRVVELYTGELWSTCKPANLQTCATDMFGISGAVPMYRRAALEAVSFSNGGFFDASYHSYKEDVDLAYRLRSAGYKAYVLLDAVAYHDRSAGGPKDLSDMTAAENKRKQSEWVRYHSYKNQLMTLYKNEYWQNFLLDFPWILGYELKKLIYFILFDRKVLKGLGEIWRLRRELREKRYEIRDKRKVGWREIRKILT